MGTFRVEIEATGNHGCQRGVRDGETLILNCGQPGCPDCLAREFVRKLEAASVDFSVGHAELFHWPGTDKEVVDNLLTGKRAGNF